MNNIQHEDGLWFRQLKRLAELAIEGLKSFTSEISDKADINRMMEAFKIIEKATSNEDCTPAEEIVVRDGVLHFMEKFDALGADNWPTATTIKIILVNLFDKEMSTNENP